VDEFRRNKKYRENLDLMLIEEAEQLHPFVNPTLTSERMEEIMEAVNKLPLMSKTVFNLFAVDGYQHNEIAEMLKISVGTSKAHLFNARKKLQEMLGKRKADQKTYSNAV
jgi:RNA polymerase sigma-70 factor (ECF subfamily)